MSDNNTDNSTDNSAEQLSLEIEPEPEPLCELCDSTEDECTCLTCEECGDRFTEGARNACDTCRYCASCLMRGRVWHYHCAGCNEGASEDSQTCNECGRADCCASFSYGSDDGNEDYLCDRCWRNSSAYEERQQRDVIQSYSTRRYPAFKPERTEENKYNLYLGVELEVECPKGEPQDVAGEIQDAITEGSYCPILFKEDGSLDEGFEMVTGPMTLPYQTALWSKVCALAVNAGARSWKHSTTGTHVHLSRAFFRSSAHLARFIVFINSESHRQHIVKLAGRVSESYAALKRKHLSTATSSQDGRYEAVNLENDATVEVRIFKGTLKKERVLAYVEFCDSVARYTKTVGTEENWSGYLDFLTDCVDTYPNVSAFFGVSLSATETAPVSDEETVLA